VLKATLLADGLTVALKTTILTWGTSYTVTVNNVKDLAQTPNTILTNSQRSFTLTYTPVDVSQITGTNEPAGPSSRRYPNRVFKTVRGLFVLPVPEGHVGLHPADVGAQRVIVETDGGAFHDSITDRQNDERRDRALEGEGLTVLRFSWNDVMYRPTSVVHTLRRALAVAA